MAQYIDKNALVAEIEKYYNECLKRVKITDSDYWNAKADAYRNVLVILSDTLEVKEVDNEQLNRLLNWWKEVTTEHSAYKAKEVDLEKEVDNWRHNHFHGRRDKEANGEYLERISQLDLAKHFFELGLSASNPITAADRGIAEEIIINLKRVEKDYRIDLTKEIEWVRNQVKKGEEVW